MSAVWMRVRVDARARWRSWLALVLIVGVGWGIVLTAVAGARRTDSAYRRFRQRTGAHDVLISADGPVVPKLVGDIARLPEVEAAAGEIGLGVEIVQPKLPRSVRFSNVATLPADAQFGRSIDRPKVIRGRIPDPNSRSEVLVNPALARALKIGIGSTITLRPEAEDNDPSTPVVHGAPFTVRLVGIGVSQDEAFPISAWDKSTVFLELSHGLYGAYPDFTAFDGGAYRLRPGTDPVAFESKVAAIKREHPEAGPVDAPVYFANEAGRQQIVAKALRPEVAALAAFAVALAATLILLVAQLVARQILLYAQDYPTLRALGVTPRALTLVAALPVLASAVVGGVIAAGVAVAASPLTPIGAARLAEPDPGVSADAGVLVIGCLALVVVLALLAIIPAIRASRISNVDAGEAAMGHSRVADAVTRSGLPSPAAAGVRMALVPGRGSSAVPVRTVQVGAFISMIAVAAAYTFGASCNHAVSTPRLFGQKWDAIVDAQFTSFKPDELKVLSDPSFVTVTGGIYPFFLPSVEGVAVPGIALRQLKGTAFPTLLQGRAPHAGDEIVLGSSTLHEIRKRVGDTVAVDLGGGKTPMRVVGRAVFPAFGLGVFTPTGLGQGAAVSADAFPPGIFEPGTYSFLLIRFARDAQPEAIKRIADACALPDLAVNLCSSARTQPPPEIESYGRVKNLPWVLTGILGLLAAATLGHGLVATVRRRRRDLAILKTLGFVRGQVSSAVAWQASTFVAIALIGIPFGVAAGRWAWTSLANQLGIPPEPRVPLLAVMATIPAAFVVANLVAALPGRAASKTPAALVLRTE